MKVTVMKKLNKLISVLLVIFLLFSVAACSSIKNDTMSDIMADSQMTYEEATGTSSKPIKTENADSEIGIRSLGINYKNDKFSDIQNLTYFHSFGECFDFNEFLYFNGEFTYSNLLQDSKDLDGTQVRFSNATVYKVIKSDDKKFELLVCFEENWDGSNQEYYNAVTNEEFFYVSGNYPEDSEYQYQKGSIVGFCGKYIDIKKYEVDGQTYNIPGIMAYCDYNPAGCYCDIVLGRDESQQITQYVFGKTATCVAIGDGHFDPIPQVILNNANAPIKNLYISDDRYTPAGSIFSLEEDSNQTFMHTADAEKFLILTYNNDASSTSIACYDKDWDLMWDNVIPSIVPINGQDLTNKNFYCVGGNLLYAFNLSNGKYLYEPVAVGESSILRKTESGVLTINTTLGKIAFVNSKGELDWTVENRYFENDMVAIQIIKDKAIIGSNAYRFDEEQGWQILSIDCKNKEIS